MLKAVGKPKVGHNHVPVSVEEQIFEFEVTVDDLFLMEVPDGRNELSKQLAGVAFFEVAVGEDVIEEFAAGGIFEDDPDVLVRFDDIIEMDDIRVIKCLHRLIIRRYPEIKETGHSLGGPRFRAQSCSCEHSNRHSLYGSILRQPLLPIDYASRT
jgi:hypothetical protein